MGDIVERLREDARGGHAYHELSDEAADEIAKLRAELRIAGETFAEVYDENERLRAALQKLETQYAEDVAELEEIKARNDLTKDYGEHSLYHARKGLERVRAALTGKP